MIASENDLGSLVYYFFREFLPVHKGVSVNTVKSYRESFKLFLPWIFDARSTKTINVAEIKSSDVMDFLKFLETERSNTPRTRNARLAALKCFFSMCYLKSACDKRALEAIQFIPTKRCHKPLIDFFDHGDVLRIFSVIDRSRASGVRDYLVLNLLYDTGMRASELAGLRLQNFDRAAETLEILGKGNKWRKIRIWPRTAQLLIDYIDNWRPEPKPRYKDQLIVSHRREALTRFGVHKISSKYLEKANIKKQMSNTKRSAAHSWRHTAAINMLHMGLSLKEIQVRLGHESLDTTGKYLALYLSIKRERVEELVRFTQTLYPAQVATKGLTRQTPEDVLKFLKTV